MTLYARPHMNGNTVDDFKKGYFSLSETERTIEACISDMGRFVVHGRNYQHLDGGQAIEAQSMDHEALDKLAEAMLVIRELRRGIEVAVTEAEGKK